VPRRIARLSSAAFCRRPASRVGALSNSAYGISSACRTPSPNMAAETSGKFTGAAELQRLGGPGHGRRGHHPANQIAAPRRIRAACGAATESRNVDQAAKDVRVRHAKISLMAAKKSARPPAANVREVGRRRSSRRFNG